MINKPMKLRPNKSIPALQDITRFSVFTTKRFQLKYLSYNCSVVSKENSSPSTNPLIIEEKYQNSQIAKGEEYEAKNNAEAKCEDF